MTYLFKSLPRLEASIVRHSDPNLKARLAASTAYNINQFFVYDFKEDL